jgi:hypothetical protein
MEIPGSPGIEIDFLQIAHRLAQQLLEAVGEIARKLRIANQERCEPPPGDEGMIERQHDDFLVHDVKRVAELARERSEEKTEGRVRRPRRAPVYANEVTRA